MKNNIIDVTFKTRADPPLTQIGATTEILYVYIGGCTRIELGMRNGEHVPYLMLYPEMMDRPHGKTESFPLYSPDLRDAIVFRKSPSSAIYHALDCNNIPNDAKVILWQAIKALQDQDKENS